MSSFFPLEVFKLIYRRLYMQTSNFRGKHACTSLLCKMWMLERKRLPLVYHTISFVMKMVKTFYLYVPCLLSHRLINFTVQFWIYIAFFLSLILFSLGHTYNPSNLVKWMHSRRIVFIVRCNTCCIWTRTLILIWSRPFTCDVVRCQKGFYMGVYFITILSLYK